MYEVGVKEQGEGAEQDEGHGSGGEGRRVDLTRRELGPATQDPVDGCPREEPDEERERDLHELREQDAPDDCAAESEDEAPRAIRAPGSPEKETTPRHEQPADCRRRGG